MRFFSKPVRAGKERWDVKTGTDPDAASVSLIPVPTTIAALIETPAPHKPTARLAAEMATYSVPCTITLWKLEADGDHHLVLTDEHGNTMIGEIPDPTFCTGSPWLPQITAAFNQFNEWPRLGKPSIVTGVLFYDKIHGQDGVAKNGVELHAVLSIVDPEGVPDGTV